jgi:2-polyprenyl-6-hydroxyphenyl methylase / 3-demethylubiquinone-9 3-methyltransferase
MARLGATVVGADAAPRNIPVARRSMPNSRGSTIDYRHTTAEDLAAAGEQFDVVLNMEVVEHVADPQGYLTACRMLLKPGGLMICSTINRNPKSFAMAIVGAEHVMRWLPKGTHDWRSSSRRTSFTRCSGGGARPGGPQGLRLQPGDLVLAPVGPRSQRQLRDEFGEAALKTEAIRKPYAIHTLSRRFRV